MARRLIELFNRRDLDGLKRISTADVEIVPLRAALEGTIYRGRDAIDDFSAALDESWESVEMDIDDVTLHGDRALAVGRLRGRARETGMEVDSPLGWVVTFEGDEVASVRTYTSVAEAREAAELRGLTEDVPGRSGGDAAVIRELCDALNANDAERLTRLTHPDVVQYGTRGGIDQERVFRGREAVMGYWNEMAEAWEALRFDPERLIEAGDLVVAFWRERARSRHSDLELESNTATIFRLRDGKVVEVRGYLDREEALQAAGVAP